MSETWGSVVSTFPVAGTLRPDGLGDWYVLDDDEHTPLGGLAVVNVSTTSITVSFGPCDEINTFVVGTDDVLGRLNWTCGASVGLSTAIIFMGNNAGPVNPQLVSNTSANLWVYGLLSTTIFTEESDGVSNDEC